MKKCLHWRSLTVNKYSRVPNKRHPRLFFWLKFFNPTTLSRTPSGSPSPSIADRVLHFVRVTRKPIAGKKLLSQKNFQSKFKDSRSKYARIMIWLGKFNMRSPAYLILPNVLTSLPPSPTPRTPSLLPFIRDSRVASPKQKLLWKKNWFLLWIVNISS